jgi:hypothetical protein
MAKRKAARGSSAGRKKAAGRKTAGRARKAVRQGSARKGSARKGTARRGPARAAKKAVRPSRKIAGRARATARKATRTTARKAAPKRAAPKRAAPKGATSSKTRAASSKKQPLVPVRKAPSLNRERRTIVDDDIVQTPPSSLDLDRTASAARSGRRSLKDRFSEHTETSPALTAGDVDADWESAYSVGDEAPGGDNPTPDQDIVDDIGRAVGNEYQDNEELKGADKIQKRDKNRWELDPASSEDWKDR